MYIEDTNKLLAQGALSAMAIIDGSYLAVKIQTKTCHLRESLLNHVQANWQDGIIDVPKVAVPWYFFLVFGVTSQGRFSLSLSLKKIFE